MQDEVGQVRELQPEQVFRRAGHDEVWHVGGQDRCRQDRRGDADRQHGARPSRAADCEAEGVAERQGHGDHQGDAARFDGMTKAMRKLSATSPVMKWP